MKQENIAKSQIKNKLKNNVFLLFIVTAILTLIYFFDTKSVSDTKLITAIEKNINKKLSENEQTFFKLKTIIGKNSTEFTNILFKRFLTYKKDLYILKDDSLLFWNNNNLDVKKVISKFKNDSVFLYFNNNSVYLAEYKISGKYIFLITEQLSTEFGKCISVGIPQNECFKIHIGNNDYYLKKSKSPILNTLTSIFFFIDFILLINLILLLYIWIFENKKPNLFYFLFFIVDLVLIRFVVYFISFPDFIKNSYLFNWEITDYYLFKTEGDIFINIIILFFIYRFLNIIKKHELNIGTTVRYVIQFVSYSIILYLFILLDKVLINQGLDFLFRFRKLDYDGLSTLIIILVTGYLSYYIIKTVNGFNKAGIENIIMIVLVIVMALLVKVETVLIIFTAIYLLFFNVLIYIKKKFGISGYFNNLLTILFISAIYSWLTIITDNERMEERQIFMSNYLSQKNDPMFEYKVENILVKFYNDTTTKTIINDNIDEFEKEKNLLKYLETKYLRNLNSSYNYQITLCREGEMLEIQPEKTLVSCIKYFSSLEQDTVFSNKAINLSLVKAEYKSIYYLADLEFKNGKKNAAFHLIIEFLKEKIPTGVGYAGLLKDENSDDIQYELFSFAVYNDTVINYKFGEFPYPVVFSELNGFKLDTFTKWNGYIHYIKRLNNNEFIVISRKQKQPAYALFPFTLFFFILQFILLIFTGFGSLKKLKESLLNYSVKIQTIYFISFISLFAIISVVSIYYINLSISRSIKGELEEKTYSVSEELQNKLNVTDRKTYVENELDLYLKKLANIFFTDINLYGAEGKLISTSRTEIFENNLQSDYINPKAYYALRFDHKLFYIDKERINNTVFYSSYFPLVLQDGTLFGYVNLPYFAKKNYLLNSRNLLFVSFFNLLVFIAILILIISYFVTKMITKPLYLLQKRISDTNLNEELVKIKWNRDDEIGHLINAYNEMVEKLKASTELLKKSERESAWREMAQQIAHEIRNPLTPMKLNIQYLLKARKEGDKEFDNKLKNISETLITQIDALNNVAAMFSDFAKIKSDKNTVFDLKNIVLKSVNLFKNRQNVSIKFTFDREKNYLVKGDENDFLRILNNLIKNALQSIDENRGGEIKISLANEGGFVKISVSDNGSGIPEEFKDKIFTPYFTTKSKGTGIGLAIVYNLVKENGGEISFETENGKGTTFYLQFAGAGNS